jgi:rubrerythrin
MESQLNTSGNKKIDELFKFISDKQIEHYDEIRKLFYELQDENINLKINISKWELKYNYAVEAVKTIAMISFKHI